MWRISIALMALTAMRAVAVRAQTSALEQLRSLAPLQTPAASAPPPACSLTQSYPICDLRALAAACGDSPFRRAALDLAALDREDPRLLLNLGRAGIRLRIDSAAVEGAGSAALYDRDNKTVVLSDSGEYSLYELSHAVDDILGADSLKNLQKTLGRMRGQRRQDSSGLLSGITDFLTAWDSQFFDTANSPEFLEAYKEYISQVRAGKIKMSWAQDDVTRLIETYMWAFGWYLTPEKRETLAREAPLLHAWVQSSLRRLASLAPAPSGRCDEG